MEALALCLPAPSRRVRPARSWFVINLETQEGLLLPSAERRRDLRPGDGVQLVLDLFEIPLSGPCGEKVWVHLVRKDRFGRYTGELEKDARTIPALKAGHPIRFRACHVRAIEDPA